MSVNIIKSKATLDETVQYTTGEWILLGGLSLCPHIFFFVPSKMGLRANLLLKVDPAHTMLQYFHFRTVTGLTLDHNL